MLLSTAKGQVMHTNSLHDNRLKSNMSQSQGAEGGDDRNSSSQSGIDSSHDDSSDAVEAESNTRDEPVPKRQRLNAEAVADPVVVRPEESNQNQQRGKSYRKRETLKAAFSCFTKRLFCLTPMTFPSLSLAFSLISCRKDGSSVDAQQALLRHLLGNGNQAPTPSAQELANAEISAQLQTILLQQQLLLAGGYYPPQFGAAAHFPQNNGTIDALARLASLSGNGLGYPAASLVAPLNPMQLLQQMNSHIPTAGNFGSYTQPSGGLPAFAQHLTGRPAVPLSIEADERTLSEFQRLVRKHIELFEAKQEDVESNAQGRNRPIVLGQVGIRCCHCSHLPPKLRCRGSTYYPTTLQGLYQAAQNMATGHLCKRCSHIPVELREELVRLKECKSSAGGGKTYWGDGVRSLGVFEAPTGLRFLPLS